MKKHIFGLGVMFVGAVLMFVFMTGEVNALTLEEKLKYLEIENLVMQL